MKEESGQRKENEKPIVRYPNGKLGRKTAKLWKISFAVLKKAFKMLLSIAIKNSKKETYVLVFCTV